jgi:hypothetical protein
MRFLFARDEIVSPDDPKVSIRKPIAATPPFGEPLHRRSVSSRITGQ